MGYKVEVKGDKLFIEVDISKKAIDAASVSKSSEGKANKNKSIASTGGFVPVTQGENPIKLGLNVIQRAA